MVYRRNLIERRKRKKGDKPYSWKNEDSEAFLIDEEITDGFTTTFLTDLNRGAPDPKDALNAEHDLQWETNEKNKPKKTNVTKCVDCGKKLEYKTRPFKRCPDCKKKHERERKRRSRALDQ